MISSASNADSTGPYLYIAQPQAAYEFGRRMDNSTITNGGDLQPWNVTSYYNFDTMSNTTQYPHLSTVPHWVAI